MAFRDKGQGKRGPRDRDFTRGPRPDRYAGPTEGRPRYEPGSESDDDIPVLVGRHPVLEALRAGRSINRIWVQEGLREGSLREVVALAKKAHIPVVEAPRIQLERLAGDLVHQGIAAQVSLKPTLELEDLEGLLEGASEPLFYILDGIQDPHNLGAIIRTADATGATAVIVPQRGAVGLTSTVARASAGAMEYVPVVRVPNLSQAIDRLKTHGVFVFAAHPTAERLYTETDWSGSVAVVIGGEGSGVRPLVKERSDGLVRLPMMGKVASLNASNAAAVIGFEIVRQRLQKLP